MSILDAPVNLFPGVLTPTPVKVLPLAEALELIRNGTYRQEVQRLQHIRATEGEARYKAQTQHSCHQPQTHLPCESDS